MLVTLALAFSLIPFFPRDIALAQQGSFVSDLNAQTQAAAGNKGAGFGAAQDPRATIARIIQAFLGILGVLLLGYIIYGGSLIFMSGGSEDKIAEGKKVIQHAVVGLVITLSAYSITLLVSRLVQGDGGPCSPDENENTDCAIVEEDRRKYNNPNFDDSNPFSPYECNYLPDGTCDLQN